MANTIAASGRLIQDPEMRKAGQYDICSFIVGEYGGKDKDGEYRPAPVWICEVWGKMGEVAHERLRKGDSVTVFGNVKREKYTNREGVEKDFLKVNVSSFDIPFQQGDQQGSQRQPQLPSGSTGSGGDDLGGDEIDDDLPF